MRSILLVIGFCGAAAPAAAFDHTHGAFDGVLKSSVRLGWVNYGAISKSATFPGYVSRLADAPVSSFNDNQALAFWINAYNALTIKLILDYRPKKTIKEIDGAWDKKTFKVGGKDLTLNHIEHKILRRRFPHPGLHTVLVCAAKSCPPLESRAFLPGNVRLRLEKATRRWVSDTVRNVYDPAAKTLRVSKLFTWYTADFAGYAAEPGNIDNVVRTFFAHYLRKPVGDDVTVGFKKYDWSLNGNW